MSSAETLPSEIWLYASAIELGASRSPSSHRFTELADEQPNSRAASRNDHPARFRHVFGSTVNQCTRPGTLGQHACSRSGISRGIATRYAFLHARRAKEDDDPGVG